MNNKCDFCQNDATRSNETFDTCESCYWEKFCSFCKELTIKEECKGHEITVKKGNRFIEDKKFSKEMIFDAE